MIGFESSRVPLRECKTPRMTPNQFRNAQLRAIKEARLSFASQRQQGEELKFKAEDPNRRVVMLGGRARRATPQQLLRFD